MNARQDALPLVQTYDDVQRLMDYIVNKFIVRNGGDFDEYRGEADVIFVEVYKWWRPDKGSKFTSSLCNAIYRRLQYLRNRERKHGHLWKLSLDHETVVDGERTSWANNIADDDPVFDRQTFEERLSNDGRVVLRLLLDSPQEIVETAIGNGGNPVNWKAAIGSYLSDIGWSGRRVKSTFKEIKEAL